MKKNILIIAGVASLLIVVGLLLYFNNSKTQSANEPNQDVSEDIPASDVVSGVPAPQIDPQPDAPGNLPSSDSAGVGQIELPKNIITPEECQKMGGEIFNTLGETEYEGYLIGKVEEFFCPCACRVDDYSACKKFFDGCNTCEVRNGQLFVCTEMYCESESEAKCVEFNQ